MIRLTVNANGVLRAVRELKHRLGDVDTMGRILKMTADLVWVRNIRMRFANSPNLKSYEEELPFSMSELDPEFVRKLSGYDDPPWASIPESQRRGALAKYGITDDIIRAIEASEPVRTGNTLMVGIGNVERLNNLTALGDTGYYLWQLLETGVGIYGPSKSPVIRVKKQIFYDRDGTQKGVLTFSTVNPGFKGRHAFLQASGDFYEADLLSARMIIQRMKKWVELLSYK